MIERLSGSSCPSDNDEPEFQELKNKDEEQNHVDHVRYSAAAGCMLSRSQTMPGIVDFI